MGQFALLVYRIVSARNLPNKPVLTAEDCLAVPGLSEEANRLLSHAISLAHRGHGVHGVGGRLQRDPVGGHLPSGHAPRFSAETPLPGNVCHWIYGNPGMGAQLAFSIRLVEWTLLAA